MAVRWDAKRKRYIVDYYPDGRKGPRPRITLPPTVKDEATALSIEHEYRYPSENSEIHADDGSTVKDLFPTYLAYCKMHKEISTYDNIKWTWEKQLSRHLGPFRISQLDKGHTTNYKRLRLLDGVKNRTVNKEMAYFMGFLKWCRVDHKISVKDFKYERLKEDKPIRIILSIQETVALIRNAELLYRVFFLALYALGLRFTECTGLKWEDLDEGNKTIIARGKGSKERLLPVADWLMYALNAIKPKSPTGFIFRSRRTGGRIIHVTKAIDRACKKAGITKHVYPHLLRHSLATHFMGWKISTRVVQEWLGHAREDTTANIYMHAEIEHLRNAQYALDGQLENHFSKEDFVPESVVEKRKRKYTLSAIALEQRRKFAPKARASKGASIDKPRKKPLS
jgi:integrase